MATSLIKYYGEFWNPHVVDWGRVGRGNSIKLDGKFKLDAVDYEGNFSKAQGVYILYEGFKATYVGKAFDTSIGKRLRDHLTDRHAGRWDMFSWYSTCTFRKGDKTLRKAGARQIGPDTVVRTLEALAILIADPPLNRKRESLPEAIEVTQIAQPVPKGVKEYLEEILARLPAAKIGP